MYASKQSVAVVEPKCEDLLVEKRVKKVSDDQEHNTSVERIEIGQPAVKEQETQHDDKMKQVQYIPNRTSSLISVDINYSRNNTDSSFFDESVLNSSCGDYDKAVAYFKNKFEKFLKKKNDPENESEKVVLTIERFADSFLEAGKLDEALYYYERALNHLRWKKSSNVTLSENEMKQNYKRLYLILIKKGNVYFVLSSKLDDSVERNAINAIELYEEAMSFIISDLGPKNLSTLMLVKNLSAARGRLAGHHALNGKPLVAVLQYIEAMDICKPYIESVKEEEHNKIIQEIIHTFLKISIRLAFIYLQKKRYDDSLALFQDVLAVTGADKEECDHLEASNKELIAKIFHNIGLTYEKMENYDESVLYYKKSLSLKEELINNVTAGYTLLGLGEAYFGSGDDVQALKYFEQGKHLILQSKDRHMNYEEFSSILRKMAILYFRTQEFDDCISCLQDAISLAQRSLYDDELYRELASLFQKISSVHFHNGKYDEALESYEHALYNRRSYLPKEDADVSSTLQYMAAVYAIKGMNEEAIKYYKESLKGSSVEDKAKILNEMGILSCKIQRKDEALTCYQKALAIIDSTLHPELLILLLNNIGNVYRDIGDLEKALTCYLDALSLCPESEKDLKAEKSNIIYNVGLVYFMRHSYAEAQDKFQKFLKAQVTDILTYDVQSNLNLAAALNSVGNCISTEGNYKEALEWYHESLELKEAILTKPNPKITGTLTNIATNEFYLGNYDTALDYLEQSLSYCKHDEKKVALIYDKFGTIFTKKNDFDKAIAYYQKALDLKRTSYGTTLCLQVLSTKHNIALVYCQKGDFKLAKSLLYEVFRLKSQLLGKRHMEVAKVILDIGCLCFATQDYLSAKNLCSQAYDIFNETKLPFNHPYMVQGRLAW